MIMEFLDTLLKSDNLRPFTVTLDNGIEVSGLLSEVRINKKERTMGKYLYDIRHTDNDWCEPATLEHSVMVNWVGTLIMDAPIEFPDGENYLSIEDYSYDDE